MKRIRYYCAPNISMTSLFPGDSDKIKVLFISLFW